MLRIILTRQHDPQGREVWTAALPNLPIFVIGETPLQVLTALDEIVPDLNLPLQPQPSLLHGRN